MAEALGKAGPRVLATVKARTYNGDAGTVDWVMSDETHDRDGEVIKADGWSVPGDVPLLWAHRSFMADPQDVIGRVVATRVEGGTFIGTVKFSRAEGHDRARLVEGMVAGGDLTNGSVGFSPIAWTDPDGSEHTREPGGPYPYSKSGRIYTKQELSEFSIVPVPSNPSAVVRMAKVFGVDIQGMIEEMVQQEVAKRLPLPEIKPSLDEMTAEEFFNTVS